MIWTPRVTVAAIIPHKDRFMLVEEYVDGRRVFNQPVGHLEDGESLLDAARREVLEETARAFEPVGLVGIYRWRMSARGETYLRFCFQGDVGERIAGVSLDVDIVDTHWLTMADLRARQSSLRSPLVLRCLEDALRKPLAPLDVLYDIS